MPFNASEIEFLEPRRQLSDLSIDHSLRMMKEDGYYIVGSAAFEAIRSHGDTGFWDKNDGDAKMGYIISVHINLAVLADGEDLYKSDDERSLNDEADLPEHFVLAHIQRLDPLPGQSFKVQIYDSGSGNEPNDAVKQLIKEALPPIPNVVCTYPKAPQQTDSHGCAIYIIVYNNVDILLLLPKIYPNIFFF